MLRFDDVLTLKDDGGVEAMGPLDPSKEDIVELCAWVFQRRRLKDAAATEMATTESHHVTTTGGHVEVFKDEGGRDKWRLPLVQVGDEQLAEGDAFGVAVAVTRQGSEEQTVVWWGHPLVLTRVGPAA